MSHIVSIKTEVRDAEAVGLACGRLRLKPPTMGEVKMFDGHVSGLIVELESWRYPVVCDLASGQLRYDNYGGHWGNQKNLDEFLQMYAVEKARLEARKLGHSVHEQPLADGSIKLVITMSEAVAR